jgi:hypothetical protein
VACLYYIYAAGELWAAALDKKNKEFTREMWDMYKERLLDSQSEDKEQGSKETD